ncbi:MAG: hypothetical protein HND53_13665 [Proteobacteria bacterium]|nr:hypothetical protein [Pseudomonadota bacterium]
MAVANAPVPHKGKVNSPYGMPRCCLISSVEPQGGGESVLATRMPPMRVPMKLNNTEGTR